MSRIRSPLAAWTVGFIAAAVIGFGVLAREAEPSRNDAHGGSAPAPATNNPGGQPVGDRDQPGHKDPTAAAGPSASASSLPTGAGEPLKDADGNFAPTGAGTESYQRYVGGDFDDTSPNEVASFGLDENGCDANYRGACVPPLPARVTCAEIGVTNFEVVNGDPQGLDPDGDGIACSDTMIIRTEYGENTEEPRD